MLAVLWPERLVNGAAAVHDRVHAGHHPRTESIDPPGVVPQLSEPVWVYYPHRELVATASGHPT